MELYSRRSGRNPLLRRGTLGAVAGNVTRLLAVVASAGWRTAFAAHGRTAGAVTGHVTRLAAVVARARTSEAASTATSTAVTTSTAHAATVAAVAAVVVAIPAGSTLDGRTTGAGHVESLGTAIITLLDGVLDRLTLVKAAEALRLDAGLVDEQLLAAIIRGDEAEALGGVEPLDLSGLDDGSGSDFSGHGSCLGIAGSTA